MEEEELTTRERLLWAFKHLDTDDSGEISVENLRAAFGRTGKYHSSDEIISMMREEGFQGMEVPFEQFEAFFYEDRLESEGREVNQVMVFKASPHFNNV